MSTLEQILELTIKVAEIKGQMKEVRNENQRLQAENDRLLRIIEGFSNQGYKSETTL